MPDATTSIALLRAVNVGGRNRVRMADLRAVLESEGLTDVRTLLQSGNAVFAGPSRPTRGLERRLERAVLERLGVETTFFVRSADEWQTLIAENPFPDQAESDPAHLLVMLLAEAPAAERLAALEDAIAGRESVRSVGRQLYMTYPDGIGRSKLTAAVIERTLANRGTARNWSTVLKLAALTES